MKCGTLSKVPGSPLGFDSIAMQRLLAHSLSLSTAFRARQVGSESMSVRVLALENLREITNKTLFFRPQETNSKRRENVIKKWQVLLRKGDIRRNKEG